MTLSISVSCLVGAVYRASCHRLGSLGAGAKAEFEVKDVYEGSQPVKGTGECLGWGRSWTMLGQPSGGTPGWDLPGSRSTVGQHVRLSPQMSLSPEWHDLCERHLSVKVTLQGTQLLPVRVAGQELSPVGEGRGHRLRRGPQCPPQLRCVLF